MYGPFFVDLLIFSVIDFGDGSGYKQDVYGNAFVVDAGGYTCDTHTYTSPGTYTETLLRQITGATWTPYGQSNVITVH